MCGHWAFHGGHVFGSANGTQSGRQWLAAQMKAHPSRANRAVVRRPWPAGQSQDCEDGGCGRSFGPRLRPTRACRDSRLHCSPAAAAQPWHPANGVRMERWGRGRSAEEVPDRYIVTGDWVPVGAYGHDISIGVQVTSGARPRWMRNWCADVMYDVGEQAT